MRISILSKPFRGHLADFFDDSILSILCFIKYSISPCNLDPTIAPFLGSWSIFWLMRHFDFRFSQYRRLVKQRIDDNFVIRDAEIEDGAPECCQLERYMYELRLASPVMASLVLRRLGHAMNRSLEIVSSPP